MERRTILSGVGVAGVVAGGAGGVAAWACQGKTDWADAGTELRRPIPAGLTGRAALLELVRCATLAPNSHNTQPWRFGVSAAEITIAPDLSRRTPIVDPDDHHLYVSLGAAAENIVQAAPTLGLAAAVSFEPAGAGVIRIALVPGDRAFPAMASAIFRRQFTRSLYDGRPVPAADVRMLLQAARSDVVVVTERAAIADLSATIIAANAAQFSNPDFITELKHWLRFSYPDALASQDGLFAATAGSPALPAGLGRAMFDLVVSAGSEGRKYADQIASSSGLAIFMSAIDDRTHWVAAGRAFERFALQATALGIRLALVNQAVEVAAFRPRLAEQLDRSGQRPDLVVRFGYALDMPWSLRRPVGDVLG